MYRIILLVVCLSACSSSKQWVKNGKDSFDANELETAMISCDYKSKMRRSSTLMLGSNNTPTSTLPIGAPKDGNYEGKTRRAANEDRYMKANQSEKQESFSLSRSANMCMKERGFEKV